MLDRMVVSAVSEQEKREHDARQTRESIEVYHESFVRAVQPLLKDFKERSLCGDLVLLLEESDGEYVADRDCQFSAFDFLPFAKVQLRIQKLCFLLDCFIYFDGCFHDGVKQRFVSLPAIILPHDENFCIS